MGSVLPNTSFKCAATGGPRSRSSFGVPPSATGGPSTYRSALFAISAPSVATPTPHDGTRPGVVRGRQQRNVEIRSAEMGSIWDGLGTPYRVSYLTGIDGDLAALRSPSSTRREVPRHLMGAGAEADAVAVAMALARSARARRAARTS